MTCRAWSRTNLEDDILWVPMEEADAEIERMSDINLDELPSYIEGLQAEIERLRKQAENAAYSTEEEINKRDSEIGRLRDQVTRLSTLVDTERSLHDAEIKRLRDANRKQANMICEQEVEIERLRAERDMTIDGFKSIVATQAEEIERLREELLRCHADARVQAETIEHLREQRNRLLLTVNHKADEIAHLREHFAIRAEGEADDARLI